MNAEPTIAGIRLAAVAAGVRYPDRKDVVLIEIAESARTAAVFTQNAFCAAPVEICRTHLAKSPPRYLLTNTGNANAGTGEQGRVDALACCQAVAEIAGVRLEQVLPFSTGVIGEALPVEKIVMAVPEAFTTLHNSGFADAAEGIMTTDLVPKLAHRTIDLGASGIVRIAGITKGSGMIKPNMATMLSYVFADVAIEQHDLDCLLSQAVNSSYNRITVDGDTSTNDSCLLVATGQGDCDYSLLSAQQKSILQLGVTELFVELAQAMIRDAEGASKFISINIHGGESSEECLQVAYAIAESPLVKTAMFASDPNWGRILAVIGRAGLTNLDVNQVNIDLGPVRIVSNGLVDPSYTESAGQAEMDRSEITVTVSLNRGEAKEVVWTSDLSHDYVRINAEYRS